MVEWTDNLRGTAYSCVVSRAVSPSRPLRYSHLVFLSSIRLSLILTPSVNSKIYKTREYYIIGIEMFLCVVLLHEDKKYHNRS